MLLLCKCDPFISLTPTVPATPTLKELSNALDSVVDWHFLGVKLGVKGHQLKIIEKNHHGDNVRCKHEMLSHWLQSAKLPTWKAVVNALCRMGIHTVASQIQRKHCRSSTAAGIIMLIILFSS